MLLRLSSPMAWGRHVGDVDVFGGGEPPRVPNQTADAAIGAKHGAASTP